MYLKLSKLQKKSLISEIKSILIVVIFALCIRTFIFELFYVPTGSMRATILEGDYIFATKYNYGFSIYSIPFNPKIFQGRILSKTPDRGDVIIMRPPHSMDQRYIKRLIGMPGEKIQIINDLIYINDKPIERQEIGEYKSESGVEFIKFKETLPNGVSFFSYKMKYRTKDFRFDEANYGPKIIESDKYFFIGDNRDNSGDSRYQLGTVPFENFIAKGRFVAFSTKEPLWNSESGLLEQINRIWLWLSSIRFERFFCELSDDVITENEQ